MRRGFLYAAAMSRPSTCLRRADANLQVALVTGACSGIGRAIAERLGSLGYELVLVSQRPAELAATASSLADAYGVRTHPIVVDLARPAAAEELYDATRVRGLAIDILVNNAGFFFFGEAADARIDQANAMLQLHVVTPSLLCTRFAREMRTRRRGHILMVSSIASRRDFPGISYYGASKKYLRGFASSLRSELLVYNVNVTCLLPGATATNLYDPNVVPVELAKRCGVMMEPAAVAEAGLHAMFAGRAECSPGIVTRLLGAAAVVLPQSAIDLARRHAPWLPPITQASSRR